MSIRHGLTALVLSWLWGGCTTADDDLGTLSQAVSGDAGSDPGPDAGGAPPVVVDDAVTTTAGQPVGFSVVANDHDPDGGALTVTVLGSDWPWSRTTFDCASDGTCNVDAYPHESGVGTITYQACDPSGLCGEAVVTVTIIHVPVNVYAEDDSATTEVDTPVDIAVLANDNENGGQFDRYSLSVIAGPWYGSATPDPDYGTIVYAPGAGYRGSDLFEYSICNTDARCSTAWVYVLVDPAGSPVVAYPDTWPVIYQSTATELYVGGNDINTAGAPPLMTMLIPPAHGTFTLDWGTIYYTSEFDYVGPDFMVYQFCADGLCAATSVRVSVRSNLEPTPVEDHVITDEDNPIDFNPLLNDTDPDGDVLHLNGPCYEGWNWPFFRGQLSCSQDGPCNFTPYPQEVGEGEIICDVCDGQYCVTSYVYLTVLRVPNPPEGTNDVETTAEDTPVAIAVLANDAFNGGRPLPETMTFAPAPAHGTNEVDIDTGVVTYSPAANYAGTDTFTYHICDVHGLCTFARVDLTITPVPDPPAFTSAATNTVQTISKTGTPVALIAVDPDGGGALTFTRIGGSLPNNLSLNANGTFTSTGGHHKGTYLSTIQVRDSSGDTSTTSLRIVVQ